MALSLPALAQTGPVLTWTIVLMKSDFAIVPQIDASTLVHKKTRFSFSWNAPTSIRYQVDYSSNLSDWTTFTDIVTSASGTFDFTNTESGGLPPARFYRLRTAP
jgi:hypothetical protein